MKFDRYFWISVILCAIALLLGAAIVTRAKAASLHTSYYSSGHRTANGERFNPRSMTGAHRTYPFGTVLRVGSAKKNVEITINDRGPWICSRHLDVSRGVAERLGFKRRGHARLNVELIKLGSGRSGVDWCAVKHRPPPTVRASFATPIVRWHNRRR